MKTNSAMNREQHLRRAITGGFDVLVVGGGITGAGIAWDLALRGLAVCLLERSDFGSGTSSVSSKMVHAGLRYLRMDKDLVEEASIERAGMFSSGAHLSRPVEYLIPYYEGMAYFTRDTLARDIQAYDEAAEYHNTAPSRMLERGELLALLPGLRRDGASDATIGQLGSLGCGASYWDGVMDDARLTVEVIHSAAEAGAVVVNYAEVLEFLHDERGEVNGARFRDRDGGGAGAEHTLNAARVVMATGAYSDLLMPCGATRSKTPEPVIRPSKGMHLILNKQPGNDVAVTFGATDSILLFAVPFRSRYLEMGTTDTDYPVQDYHDLDSIRVTEDEVRYNMEYLEFLFPGMYNRDSIVAAFAGVRPLVRPGAAVSAEDTSRKHKIWKTDAGVWVIGGGKYTTFRRMAQDLCDQLLDDLESSGALSVKPQPCSTEGLLYHGAPPSIKTPADRDAWLEKTTRELRKQSGNGALSAEQATHLAEAYGTAAFTIAARIAENPELGRPISEVGPWPHAEIGYCVENEMCRSVDDFLRRRTQLRFVETQGLDAVETVGREMSGLLEWSNARIEREISAYQAGIEECWTPT